MVFFLAEHNFIFDSFSFVISRIGSAFQFAVVIGVVISRIWIEYAGGKK